MTQSMLKRKRIPKELCAVYLSNRSPTRSVWGKTPQEAWNGRKPNISHLRVFESIAYGCVPDQKRRKLDDKSEKYVFISYDSSSKGYKLYNPSNEKVISSKDVVFDEEESTWDWNVQEVEHYNFFPPSKGEMQPRQKPISPPRSPNHEVLSS